MDGLPPEIPFAYKTGKKFASTTTVRDRTTVTVRIEPDGREIELSGRVAWMLRKLVEAGPRGLTTLDLQAGTRVSAHVFKLRRAGLSIGSKREPHGGEYPGQHSRYCLDTDVTLIEDCDA